MDRRAESPTGPDAVGRFETGSLRRLGGGQARTSRAQGTRPSGASSDGPRTVPVDRNSAPRKGCLRVADAIGGTPSGPWTLVSGGGDPGRRKDQGSTWIPGFRPRRLRAAGCPDPQTASAGRENGCSGGSLNGRPAAQESAPEQPRRSRNPDRRFAAGLGGKEHRRRPPDGGSGSPAKVADFRVQHRRVTRPTRRRRPRRSANGLRSCDRSSGDTVPARATPRRRDGTVIGSTVSLVGVSSETRTGWDTERSPPRVDTGCLRISRGNQRHVDRGRDASAA